MNYIVVASQPLRIFNECEIPIPLSCPMGEMEARKFANARRFLSADWRNAEVISESKYRMLGGITR